MKRIFFLFDIFIFFVSCGIPSFIYLIQPNNTQPFSSIFKIQTSVQKKILPGGIELYYKFYKYNNVENDYSNDYDSIKDSASNISNTSIPRSYHRFTKKDDLKNSYSYPLLGLTEDEMKKSLSFDLDFLRYFRYSENPRISGQSRDIELFRDVYNDEEKSYKSFGDMDLDSDSDVKSIKSYIQDDNYCIGIIAATYAISENLESVYSKIASLGYSCKN